jgi:alkanesulfonate monooxygenase SsuD/methylene tetrahydromethanopterin reductase-like flavin-dependent oxidoreductase (luciferase family)
MTRPSLGLCFHRDASAADVVMQARRAEELGFDEFWVIEDCFFTSGVALASAALTATESIKVGIGIVPAVARNPAITAMEFATLAQLGPGRFHGGIGHGVQAWMAQMGVRPSSPLNALEETVTAVRGLLHGERLSVTGRYVNLDGVALEPAPSPPPLVSAGVRGPKSLALSGRVADGTILADFCGVEYLRWAREQIGVVPHRVTVFATMGVGLTDGELRSIRGDLGFHLGEVANGAPLSLRMTPFYDDLEDLAAEKGWVKAAQEMPSEWWSMIGAIGSPDQAASYVGAMADAGADAIAFFPDPADPLADAERFAATVMSQL